MKQTRFEDQLEIVEAIDRLAWRQWLAEHHQTAIGIWLLYYKVGSGKPSIRYPEAVQEALCFGWIDSKVQTLDDDRYRQIFTPRKPGSVWSKLNKQYVANLIEQGLMTEAGMAKIIAAQQDGSWNALDEIEALVIPIDLEQALVVDQAAQQNFQAFSNSVKKNILSWIGSARRPETRSNRIQQTIKAAAQNRNPLARSKE
ncbi:YdeI/OmpD-associated family protein [Leptolyngbya sp. FACHB-711]|uniref:YdeI/OmpD-associated family protein n=1 Tax=unclassified Leptolyngbya TaxID=2650499 RepID=UPI001687861E|nr:YdeI/OmpD-associated family protein [Leptolyngbya sp. FACHB-711]MBD1851554.1 YdeI/OmpD-associated family protein [Cyanobacteria bacterium FACHB-502]MBD2025019.1 YdeI/OmpD-associated family protein [Leptolyngbya sp. FACHB-711]